MPRNLTSLTHNAVAVAVSHILIRRMTARHRRDAVRARASAHVMRPLLLSSYNRYRNCRPPPAAALRRWRRRRRRALIGELHDDGLAQPASTRRAVEASAWFIVRLYLRLTSTTWFTYQHWFRAGSHSARSLAIFWCLFTLGLARVRLSRSRPKAFLAALSTAHRPLSCASLRATMCSMSVSPVLAK